MTTPKSNPSNTSSSPRDQQSPKTVVLQKDASQVFKQQRTSILAAGALLVSGVLALIYATSQRDGVDFVLVKSDVMSGPVVLEKVEDTRSAADQTTWMHDFAGVFVRFFFIRPEDNKTDALKSLQIQQRYTTGPLRDRASVLIDSFDSFNSARVTKFAKFYPVNDLDSFSFRRMEDGSIRVRQPGTWITFDERGERLFDAVLNLDLVHETGSITKDDAGLVNKYGLLVSNAFMEYYENPLSGGDRQLKVHNLAYVPGANQ